MTRPIGILDSGVGGLTVLKEAERRLPNESFIYIGDNGRCPYGTRTTDEIKQFTHELAHFLVTKDVKMIVIACNTATAIALESLQKELDIPVIGVIDAGVSKTLDVTKGRVVVTATEATVRSDCYGNKLREADAQLNIFERSCSPLVPLIENPETTTEEIDQAIKTLFTPIRELQPDTVILGCTHFPILEDQIQAFLGSAVTLVDAGRASVDEVVHRLAKEDSYAADNDSQPTGFYTTGEAQAMAEVGSAWLGRAISVETVPIDLLKRG